MILVVGATGQLGAAVVLKLVKQGRAVRAFVRPASHHAALAASGAELAFGDLADPASVDRAAQGVEAIVATANAVIPGEGDSFERTEGLGYANLIAAAKRQSIGQVVFVSTALAPFDEEFPTGRYKRLNERRLTESGLTFTIVRSSLIMDDWFALIGSKSAMPGEGFVTLRRPFWFSGAFMKLVGGMIERRGLALVPGDGRTRHAFIANDDLAEVMVAALGHSAARNQILEAGGPEVLTWDEVVAAYAAALQRPVRALHVPAAVFRLQASLFRPLSEAASNILSLNRLAGAVDTPYDGGAIERMFGLRLTTVTRFIARQLEDAEGPGARRA